MFLTKYSELLLRLSLFWCVYCILLPETEYMDYEAPVIIIKGLRKQMMKDLVSKNWEKSVELMRRHLDNSTLAYKQLNKITEYDKYPVSAAAKGYIDLIQIMLDNGLPINTRYPNNYTLLHFTAQYGYYKLIKFLIERGANLNMRTVDGVIPLHFAAGNGNVSVVQLLVENGADINATDDMGNTPLHWAAHMGHESVVQLLVDNGCDTTIRNKENKTALEYADEWKMNITLRQKYEETPAIIIKGLREQMMKDIESKSWEKSVELMRRHLDNSTVAYKQLNKITWYDNCPVGAATLGYIDLIRIMLDNGLPINIRYTNENVTMLHCAAQHGYYTLTNVLIKRGADVNVRADDSITPLHLAAFNGNVSVVRLLLEKGADINATDVMGNTPLHWAAHMGHESAVHVLVANGCDTTIRNKKGETALNDAFAHKIENIALKLVR